MMSGSTTPRSFAFSVPQSPYGPITSLRDIERIGSASSSALLNLWDPNAKELVEVGGQGLKSDVEIQADCLDETLQGVARAVYILTKGTIRQRWSVLDSLWQLLESEGAHAFDSLFPPLLKLLCTWDVDQQIHAASVYTTILEKTIELTEKIRKREEEEIYMYDINSLPPLAWKIDCERLEKCLLPTILLMADAEGSPEKEEIGSAWLSPLLCIMNMTSSECRLEKILTFAIHKRDPTGSIRSRMAASKIFNELAKYLRISSSSSSSSSSNNAAGGGAGTASQQIQDKVFYHMLSLLQDINPYVRITTCQQMNSFIRCLIGVEQQSSNTSSTASSAASLSLPTTCSSSPSAHQFLHRLLLEFESILSKPDPSPSSNLDASSTAAMEVKTEVWRTIVDLMDFIPEQLRRTRVIPLAKNYLFVVPNNLSVISGAGGAGGGTMIQIPTHQHNSSGGNPSSLFPSAASTSSTPLNPTMTNLLRAMKIFGEFLWKISSDCQPPAGGGAMTTTGVPATNPSSSPSFSSTSITPSSSSSSLSTSLPNLSVLISDGEGPTTLRNLVQWYKTIITTAYTNVQQMTFTPTLSVVGGGGGGGGGSGPGGIQGSAGAVAAAGVNSMNLAGGSASSASSSAAASSALSNSLAASSLGVSASPATQISPPTPPDLELRRLSAFHFPAIVRVCLGGHCNMSPAAAATPSPLSTSLPPKTLLLLDSLYSIYLRFVTDPDSEVRRISIASIAALIGMWPTDAILRQFKDIYLSSLLSLKQGISVTETALSQLEQVIDLFLVNKGDEPLAPILSEILRCVTIYEGLLGTQWRKKVILLQQAQKYYSKIFVLDLVNLHEKMIPILFDSMKNGSIPLKAQAIETLVTFIRTFPYTYRRHELCARVTREFGFGKSYQLRMVYCDIIRSYFHRFSYKWLKKHILPSFLSMYKSDPVSNVRRKFIDILPLLKFTIKSTAQDLVLLENFKNVVGEMAGMIQGTTSVNTSGNGGVGASLMSTGSNSTSGDSSAQQSAARSSVARAIPSSTSSTLPSTPYPGDIDIQVKSAALLLWSKMYAIEINTEYDRLNRKKEAEEDAMDREEENLAINLNLSAPTPPRALNLEPPSSSSSGGGGGGLSSSASSSSLLNSSLNDNKNKSSVPAKGLRRSPSTASGISPLSLPSNTLGNTGGKESMISPSSNSAASSQRGRASSLSAASGGGKTLKASASMRELDDSLLNDGLSSDLLGPPPPNLVTGGISSSGGKEKGLTPRSRTSSFSSTSGGGSSSSVNTPLSTGARPTSSSISSSASSGGLNKNVSSSASSSSSGGGMKLLRQRSFSLGNSSLVGSSSNSDSPTSLVSPRGMNSSNNSNSSNNDNTSSSTTNTFIEGVKEEDEEGLHSIADKRTGKILLASSSPVPSSSSSIANSTPAPALTLASSATSKLSKRRPSNTLNVTTNNSSPSTPAINSSNNTGNLSNTNSPLSPSLAMPYSPLTSPRSPMSMGSSVMNALIGAVSKSPPMNMNMNNSSSMNQSNQQSSSSGMSGMMNEKPSIISALLRGNGIATANSTVGGGGNSSAGSSSLSALMDKLPSMYGSSLDAGESYSAPIVGGIGGGSYTARHSSSASPPPLSPSAGNMNSMPTMNQSLSNRMRSTSGVSSAGGSTLSPSSNGSMSSRGYSQSSNTHGGGGSGGSGGNSSSANGFSPNEEKLVLPKLGSSPSSVSNTSRSIGYGASNTTSSSSSSNFRTTKRAPDPPSLAGNLVPLHARVK